jgi:hypothetical protein
MMNRFLFFVAISATLFLAGCIGDDIVEDLIEPRIQVTNPIDSLAVGDEYQFETAFRDELGQTIALDVSWSSDDETIISITEQGLATGISEGSTTLFASANYEGSEVTEVIEVAVGEETVISEPTQRSGTLQTTSSYVLQGDFTLRETDTGLELALASNYQASSSLPGLYVYLTNNPNTINGAYEIGMTTTFNGAHTYSIPDDISLSDYDYVLYFCKPFAVKVGDGQFEN